MKKLFISFFALVFLFSVGLPCAVHALNVNNFEHSYSGTWAKKYDNFDVDGIMNETGTITIAINSMLSTGDILEAIVTFDDADLSYTTTGYIYKKHGKFHIVLNYSYLSGDYYIYGLSLTGHITKKKIKGTYDHFDEYYTQYWGGNIRASRVYN